jgi:hypothetical protein
MRTVVEQLRQRPLAALQQFVRKPHERPEICELCATHLPTEHSHLFEVEKRRICCACQACAILFIDNSRQRYRRIPREVRRLDDFLMDDQQWDSLLIPIRLAFFVRNSTAGRTLAQYPSPGGALESSLDLEYWKEIVERNPVVNQFAPDVEALLVNRLSDPPRYYRAPIDYCYQLVGILRMHWRGLSGGQEVWRQVDEFFRRLDEAARGHRA